ncbi:MAG: hypothetical protein ACRDFX_13415, partial [Chloroflexota bacterium]
LVAIPFAVYTFAPIVVPRNLDTTLPFTAALSAGAVYWLCTSIRSRIPHAAAPTAILVAMSGALLALPLLGVRSGFAEASLYVARHDGSGALVVNEVMTFYMRSPGTGCDSPRLPVRVASLAGIEDIDDQFAVIDQYSSPIARYLAHHARLVARYSTLGYTRMVEDLIASENGMAPSSTRLERVDVYNLANLNLPERAKETELHCTLDRLA